jgi:hypothetical protein
MKMKRAVLVILGIIAVCSVCFAGIVSAAKAGYGFTIAQGADISTWDGQIDPATEWDDSYKDSLYNGWTMTTSFFRDKWGTTPAVCENWLIECLTDTAMDSGDWWELCIDNTQSGGSAPQTGDFKVNFSGAQGVKVWEGTGSGWAASSAAVGSGGDVFAGTTISASPASATPHRIVEIYLSKLGALGMGFNNNERLAIHDGVTGDTLMWPPFSSADVPDTYGAGTTSFSGAIPEGLTVGIMVALSSIAVIVSIRYFRKQPKI